MVDFNIIVSSALQPTHIKSILFHKKIMHNYNVYSKSHSLYSLEYWNYIIYFDRTSSELFFSSFRFFTVKVSIAASYYNILICTN